MQDRPPAQPKWSPSVTVAAIIEQDGRFLLIEEETSEGLRLNQPAGHLEPDESLQQAVIRETLEETAYDFTPTALIGVYLVKSTPPNNRTWLRFAFTGTLGNKHERALDHGIVRTLWATHDEIRASHAHHRTPALLQCVDDYVRGQRLPLEVLHTHASVGTMQKHHNGVPFHQAGNGAIAPPPLASTGQPPQQDPGAQHE